MTFSKSRWGRALAIGVICGFLPMTTAGCFGRFQLVREVYDFNKTVDSNKWVQWLVFLVLSIVPVYGIAAMLDALFANSVEFWTGNNPVVGEVTRTIEGENGELATATFRPGGIVDVEIVASDGTVHTLTLVKGDEGVVAMDAEGRLVGSAHEIDGRMVFEPAH